MFLNLTQHDLLLFFTCFFHIHALPAPRPLRPPPGAHGIARPHGQGVAHVRRVRRVTSHEFVGSILGVSTYMVSIWFSIYHIIPVFFWYHLTTIVFVAPVIHVSYLFGCSFCLSLLRFWLLCLLFFGALHTTAYH